MAKVNNTARRVPVSETLKAAETAPVIQTEAIHDMGTDNPAPVTNSPPILGDFKATAETKAEAVHNMLEVIKDMRTAARKVGTVFDQMIVTIADYGSFLVAANNALPDVKTLKREFMAVAAGKLFAVYDSEAGKWELQESNSAKNAKKNDKLAAKVAANSRIKPPKVVDHAASFMGVNTNTFNIYIEPACKAALLVMLGSDTTYRKGLRYSLATKDHNIGDPVLSKITESGNERLIPFPLDGDYEQPEGTYVGVVYNDHALHPYLEVEGLDKAKWPLKTEYNETKYRPFRGATLTSVDIHYSRFIGKLGDDGKTMVKTTVNELTGMPPKTERKTQGTQAEGTTETKAQPQVVTVDLASIGMVDFLKQAVTLVKNLPKKDNATVLTDEVKGLLADLHRLLDENIEARNEGEEDEQLNKVMTA